MQEYFKPFAVLTGLFFWHSTLHAVDSVQLTSCVNFGTAKSRCKLEKSILIAELPEAMTASYDLTYRFPCKGHQTGLAFDAGEEKKFLAYTNADQDQQTITVEGSKSLHFIDSDPNATYRATLLGLCELTIEKVSITPSTKSITEWIKDAKNQAKIIDLSIDRYQLANDYESYAKWDKAQTQTLLTSSEGKVILFEGRCNEGDQGACRVLPHFKVFVGALKAKQQGSPIPILENSTGINLIEVYKNELDDEVKKGREMVQRFQRWGEVVTEELETALKSLEK